MAVKDMKKDMKFACDLCPATESGDYDEIVGKDGIIISACVECTWKVNTNCCEKCDHLFQVDEEDSEESICYRCENNLLNVSKGEL